MTARSGRTGSNGGEEGSKNLSQILELGLTAEIQGAGSPA